MQLLHCGPLSLSCSSLVALSLILALLRFKPAPLYILDEVDAALDLSHTQNIGQLIKQQFPQSQVKDDKGECEKCFVEENVPFVCAPCFGLFFILSWDLKVISR